MLARSHVQRAVRVIDGGINMDLPNNDAFPVNSLPPLFYGAIREACSITGVPAPLAAGLAFTSAATACQGHIRVRSPADIESPVSLFCVHVAKSGERKSTVERLFVRGVRDFQIFHEERAACHAVERARPEKKLNVASKKAEKARDRADDDAGILDAHFLAHAEVEPKHTLTPKLSYADTTPEALLHKLATRWPSAILQSSEASLILAGKATRNLGSLNILWDGGEVDVDRRNGESFVVRDAQLSASLMVQPGVIQKFISKGSGHARDIGFLARCLICAPTSTQGMRQLYSLEPKVSDCLDKFAQVIRQVLRGHYSDEGVLCSEKTVLQFSPEAAGEWLRFYNWVESCLLPGGYYSDIPDFASKVCENIARMAAIFHVMEGKTGNFIDSTATRSAVAICSWYLNEFKRLFGDAQQLSEEFTNARILERWLQEKCIQVQRLYLEKSYVRNFGPNRLREKRVLEGALNQLIWEGKLATSQQNKKHYIHLYAQYFGNRPPPYLEPDRRLPMTNTVYY